MTTSTLQSKVRVAVLMGGRSIEREVSFNSGRTICDHLDSVIYEVIPLYQTLQGTLFILPWHFLHRGKTSDFEHRLKAEACSLRWDELKGRVDFVYTALHGKYAEDGVLQGMLSVLGIPYLGSDILTGALCMNKSMHRDFLKAHGLKVPLGISISASELSRLMLDENYIGVIVEEIERAALPLPYIVKPASEGSSIGVSVVFDRKELRGALLGAALCDSREIQSVVIEEKISGMEFVCICLQMSDGSFKALPITEVVHEEGTHFLDYQQKYMPGKAVKITPARLPLRDQTKIQDTCIAATKALGFSTISRIDGFLSDKGEVVLLDSQPITGMAPSTFLFDQAAEINMSHTQLINHLIEVDLLRYGFNSKLFY